MKQSFLLFPFVALLAACGGGQDPDAEHGHAHDAQGNHVDDGYAALEPGAYTLCAKHFELFVEFRPLTVGQTTRFAAHLTRLGAQFTAVDSGSVRVELTGNGAVTADTPTQAGIFRPEITPTKQVTSAQLLFIATAYGLTDTFTIATSVFPSVEDAAASEGPPDAGGEITYLKEQAWKTEFANEAVLRTPFASVVKAPGRLLPAPEASTVLTAPASGKVMMAANVTAGSAIGSGEVIFRIATNATAVNNLQARVAEAGSELERARADYERAVDLAKDKIVSQRELEQRKATFDHAQAEHAALSHNYRDGAIVVVAPASGQLLAVDVTNGTYVEEGQALGTLVHGDRLMLRAELPARHANVAANIRSAVFTTPNGTAYDTDALKGSILTRGGAGNGVMIPIAFAFANPGGLLPNTVVDVALRTENMQESLTIPRSALIEEQGLFFVYVQTSGESFTKREVQLGENDGLRVVVKGGLKEGERVVSRGAMQLKLSTLSGVMPAHGHEH